MTTSDDEIIAIAIDAEQFVAATQPIDHGSVRFHATKSNVTIDWTSGAIEYACCLNLASDGTGPLPVSFTIDSSLIKALVSAASAFRKEHVLMSIDPSASAGPQIELRYLHSIGKWPVNFVPHRAIPFTVDGPAANPTGLRSAIARLLPFCHSDKKHDKHSVQFSDSGAFADDDRNVRRSITSPTPFSFRISKDTARGLSRFLSTITGDSVHQFADSSLMICNGNVSVRVRTDPVLPYGAPNFHYTAFAQFDPLDLGSAILKITKQASPSEHLRIALDQSTLTISAPIPSMSEAAIIRVPATNVDLGGTADRSLSVQCHALKRAAHAMLRTPVRLSVTDQLICFSQDDPGENISVDTFVAEPAQS